MMSRIDDREEMPWLGGEAHVRPSNGRQKNSLLWRWLVSWNIPALAGAAVAGVALGSLVTAKRHAEHRIPRSQNSNLGAPPSGERQGAVERNQTEERCVREAEAGSIGSGMILAGLGLGVLAGAAVALLTTPEPGSSVRRRVTRGIKTARQELDDIVDETQESWNQVREDTRRAVKRTAARIKDAAQATKEAVAEGTASVRKTP